MGAAGWLLMASPRARPVRGGCWPPTPSAGAGLAGPPGGGPSVPESTAAASGITQTGVALGLLLGPPLVGYVAVSEGWRWAWIGAAAAALVGAAVIVSARGRLLRVAG